MISTNMVNRFNTIRALIVCSSPQVAEEDGCIVTRMRKGNSMRADDIIAKLAHPLAYEELCTVTRHNPLSVELVWLPEYPEPVIRLCKNKRHLAYMLPS